MARLETDVLDVLRKRYAKPEIPPCCVCGAALSIQACGGGRPTVWACSGRVEDVDGKLRFADGRRPADEHYSRSRYEDYARGGDADVLALCDEVERLRAMLDTAAERDRALCAEVDDLRAALAPFAAVYRADMGDEFDDDELLSPEIEARHWKRAAALKGGG